MIRTFHMKDTLEGDPITSIIAPTVGGKPVGLISARGLALGTGKSGSHRE